MKIDPKLPQEWLQLLRDEFTQPYFYDLKSFLLQEKRAYRVYPKGKDIFNAFYLTSFQDIKVVILGQDPYHGANQAHGLAFSVQEGVAHPPSLQNIFKELHDDIGCEMRANGNLDAWAKQGVFLLNTVLSVRANSANSHRGVGWERFTDRVIATISEKREHVVFILWGRPAQQKISLIDGEKHLVIASPHPSPLSAYRGFFGSRPFSRANDYLTAHAKTPIEWCR